MCHFMMMTTLSVKAAFTNNFLIYVHLSFYIVSIYITDLSLEITTNKKEHFIAWDSKNPNCKNFTHLS